MEKEEAESKKRIIGGDPVLSHSDEAPFLITYRVWTQKDYCTGSMINRKFALTAARCFHELFHIELEFCVDISKKEGHYWEHSPDDDDDGLKIFFNCEKKNSELRTYYQINTLENDNGDIPGSDVYFGYFDKKTRDPNSYSSRNKFIREG